MSGVLFLDGGIQQLGTNVRVCESEESDVDVALRGLLFEVVVGKTCRRESRVG